MGAFLTFHFLDFVKCLPPPHTHTHPVYFTAHQSRAHSLATLDIQASTVDLKDPQAAALLLRGSPLLHIDHEGITKDECKDIIAIRKDLLHTFSRFVMMWIEPLS